MKATAILATKTDADDLGALLRQQLALLGRLDVAVRDLAAALREREPRAGTHEWLTARQAAARLGMSVKALYAAVEAGGPLATAASRLGRRLRFHRAGLDRLLLHRSASARTLTSACPVAPKG